MIDFSSLVFLSLANTIIKYAWLALLLPITAFTKYKLHFIDNEGVISLLLKDASVCSYYNHNKYRGILLSKKYIALINDGKYQNECYLICHDKYYESITKEDDKPADGRFTICVPYTTKYRTILINHVRRWINELKPWQAKLMEQINEEMAKKDGVNKGAITVLLSGESGIGKSSIADIVASKLGIKLVIGYTGINNTSLISIYYALNPNNNYYVVLLDECDNSLDTKIKDEQEKDLGNKQNWNMTLDKINKGIYGNIIFIATTNMPIADFPDQSLVADHRWDIKYNY